ncbi:MAG TPA: M17 family peptidase N-terminal domain-containing protein, partial [Dongiaceae bacterium]
MKISFVKSELPSAGTIVVGVLEEHRLTPTAQQVDKLTKGAIARALGVGRFKGRPDEQLAILAPPGIDASRILLIGLGKADSLDALTLQAVGGRIATALNAAGEQGATVAVDEIAGARLGTGEMAAHMALGARLRSYRFDKYRTREKPEQKPTLKRLAFALDDPAAAKKASDPLERIAEGVMLTRDLVSEPANVIYPESLAERAKKLADLGVQVEVLGEKQMKKLGMGALLGVGQGSAHESQLVIMQWRGASDAKQRP